MRALLRGGLVAATVLATGAAGAEESGKSQRGWPQSVGVGLDASVLLGIGLSIGVPVGERFNVRGVYHGYTYSHDFEDDGGVKYDAELKLKTVGVFADWHPFKGAFRLTTGFVSNGNQINLKGTDTGSGRYEVGDCTFQSDPADPLTVSGVVDFKSSAPYLGIGWGGNMHAGHGFYGTFDLGVLFSGAPNTDLSGRGSASNTDPVGKPQCGGPAPQNVSTYPEFQQAIQDAERDANEESKNYKLWPNLSFGIGWRF